MQYRLSKIGESKINAKNTGMPKILTSEVVNLAFLRQSTNKFVEDKHEESQHFEIFRPLFLSMPGVLDNSLPKWLYRQPWRD